MGGKYGVLYEFSSDGWNTLVKNTKDVKVSAQFAAMITAGVTVETSEETSLAESFLKETTSSTS